MKHILKGDGMNDGIFCILFKKDCFITIKGAEHGVKPFSTFMLKFLL